MNNTNGEIEKAFGQLKNEIQKETTSLNQESGALKALSDEKRALEEKIKADETEILRLKTEISQAKTKIGKDDGDSRKKDMEIMDIKRRLQGHNEELAKMKNALQEEMKKGGMKINKS
jgi:chromosome segregation ATPase